MKEKKEERLYLNIPESVLIDDDLSTTDRFLIAIMIAFDNDDKGCFASNSRLSKYLNCSVGTISRSIKLLLKTGHLKSSEADEKRGGRGYIRKVRDDLKYRKSDEEGSHGTHSKIADVSSHHASYKYKGIKKRNIKEKDNLILERRLVENELKISLHNRWDFYQICKNKYEETNPIYWDSKNKSDLVELLNNFYRVFKKDFRSIEGKEKRYLYLSTVFELVIKSPQNFFSDSSLFTFNKHLSAVLVSTKFKKSLDTIKMNFLKEDHYGF